MKQLKLPFKNTPAYWKSQARIAGEASEKWFLENICCPLCDGDLEGYKTNYPVKDFHCKDCSEEFQLKASKSFKPSDGKKITSSSFEKWYESLQKGDQPNLIVLKYTLKDAENLEESTENPFKVDKNTVSLRGYRIFKKDGYVKSIYLVKKEEITEDCLEKREELSEDAERSGWQGSYLKIDEGKFTKIFPKEGENDEEG